MRTNSPFKLISLVAVAGLVSSCLGHADRSSDVSELMQDSRDWSGATAAGNVDAIVSYWAEDAVVMIPGLATLRGKPAIRKYVEQSLKTPGFRISWEPLEGHVSAAGDLGYLIERSSISMPDATGKVQTQQFRVITIWKRDRDHKWRNVIDSSIPN